MKPIVGLEIHVQLKTQSKMFCSCSAAYFNDEPNTHMCPTCLGLPGALPRTNKKAMEQAVKAGVLLGCEIHSYSRFDRKNYMYPDLFKGYQITQYEFPIATRGHCDVSLPDGSSLRVAITRAHMEEDTAKSTHTSEYTLVDGNKAGIPLLEIVSEPDMHSSHEASAYAKTIYQLLRFFEVSDCDMEKGQMRFDVNVNVEISEKGKRVVTPIVEIKNLNSFRSLERAIEYEVIRQQEEFHTKGEVMSKGNKTTRGWSDDKGETYLLRSKEEAEDYRYFPDPDLPVVYMSPEAIEEIKASIGKFPQEVHASLLHEGVHDDVATFFIDYRAYYEYLCEGLTRYKNTRSLANFIKGDVASYNVPEESLNDVLPISEVTDLLTEIDKGEISLTAAKVVLASLIAREGSVKEIINAKGLSQESNEGILEEVIDTVIAENLDVVAAFKAGKSGASMYIVGQVMKQLRGKGNPAVISKIVNKKLS